MGRLFEPRVRLAGAGLAGVLLLTAWVSGWGAAAWASLAIGGVYGLRPAVESIARRKVNIDVLMVVGAGLAAGVGKPGEGALLLFLFTLSGALEALAMERTARDVRALERLMPREAQVRRDGAWVRVETASLVPGDEVLVSSGELIPADAEVLEGTSEIDEATLTGESLPRAVEPGSEVYSGTLNASHPLRARVVKPPGESSIQKIVAMVTRARAQREPIQRVIDRLGEPYAVGVFGLSIATLALWRFGFGRGWEDSAFTAITLLIVASPCALVIATPTATLAAISRGAREGVLFKGGQAIERLARIAALCLDKTGTLTRGRLRVERMVIGGGWTEDEALAVAAALEEGSTHPIARAIVREARARSVAPGAIASPRHIPGRGIVAHAGGREVRLGNVAHAGEDLPAEGLAAVDETRASGGAVAVLARSGGAWGVFGLRDEPRAGSRELVARLHVLGIRPVVMLTGDHRTPAERVASETGIDETRSELLPEHKVAAIAELRARTGGRVGVVGDGVNDAPALAAADASIAIGSMGSGAALESADIVLLGEDLGGVAWGIRLARRARATIRVNLVIAIGVIAVMAGWTLAGSYAGRPLPLSLGVLAHEGSTLLVVLNSLLLLGARGAR